MTVRTRFAPSPTGYLHIGGVRTALFNWLLARQAGGQFILRIDDTDSQRNVSEALSPILQGFHWLGIDWDEGPNLDGIDSFGPHQPYFQSQRSHLYRAAALELMKNGHAYRDYATPEELAQQREAAQSAGRVFVYDRQWMAETDSQAAAFQAEGRSAVIRLKMPRQGVCQFHDLIRGPVEFEWSSEQDHVIQRSDGSCLYHLASVVDDYAMGITHVVRAVEHLSNTPRQIFIAQALGYPLPAYAHLPFVAEPGGSSKLSKRKLAAYLKHQDFAKLFELGQQIATQVGQTTNAETFNPVIVDFYRTIGFLPDAILNYLLLLGWSLDDSREDFSKYEMIELFDLQRVNKAPASFDPQKLLAFQSRWMSRLTMESRVEQCLPFLDAAGLISHPPSEEQLNKVKELVQAAGERIRMGGDILEFKNFFLLDSQVDFAAEDFQKHLRDNPAGREYLQKLRGHLALCPSSEPAALEKCLKDFLESEAIKFKQIIQPLRVATTGRASGFGIYDALSILGIASSLARIDQALALSNA
jgi:glutamyl-tRNA synthetase